MTAAVATAMTLVILIGIAGAFAALWATEGEKMKAALAGRSWSSAARPVMRTATVRFSRAAAPTARPLRATAQMRAAA